MGIVCLLFPTAFITADVFARTRSMAFTRQKIVPASPPSKHRAAETILNAPLCPPPSHTVPSTNSCFCCVFAVFQEDRDTWKAKTIRLREQLDATTANAAAGDSRALALAVQSARKMSKNVTALSKRLDLHSDNVRENEDELSRAAAIIAEKDAQVARAGQTLADARQEEAAVRTELAESKADIARVGAALGAATARVEAVETEIVGVKSENERLGGKNADLREESAGFKRDQEELRVESSRVKGENAGLAERLGTAQEEIGRLEGEGGGQPLKICLEEVFL